MRLSWHQHKVTNAGQVKHDVHFWGDGTTQKAMLHYAGQRVVIGIEPDNPLAPAMIYEWNDVERTGRLLLDALPAVPESQHNDQASKQRAKDEKQRPRRRRRPTKSPRLTSGSRPSAPAFLKKWVSPCPCGPRLK